MGLKQPCAHALAIDARVSYSLYLIQMQALLTEFSHETIILIDGLCGLKISQFHPVIGGISLQQQLLFYMTFMWYLLDK